MSDTHQTGDDVELFTTRERAHVVVQEHGEHLGGHPLLFTAAHHGRFRQSDDAE